MEFAVTAPKGMIDCPKMMKSGNTDWGIVKPQQKTNNRSTWNQYIEFSLQAGITGPKGVSDCPMVDETCHNRLGYCTDNTIC